MCVLRTRWCSSPVIARKRSGCLVTNVCADAKFAPYLVQERQVLLAEQLALCWMHANAEAIPGLEPYAGVEASQASVWST
jgi:hypothetical protein